MIPNRSFSSKTQNHAAHSKTLDHSALAVKRSNAKEEEKTPLTPIHLFRTPHESRHHLPVLMPAIYPVRSSSLPLLVLRDSMSDPSANKSLRRVVSVGRFVAFCPVHHPEPCRPAPLPLIHQPSHPSPYACASGRPAPSIAMCRRVLSYVCTS
jgi:hypothetical protein